SFFIAASVPSGSARALLRSKITRAGTSARIAASAAAGVAANLTSTPACVAADLIFDLNMRSSTRARIIPEMLMEIRAVGPFFKNGFVVGCETTREAVLIDPGDEA